MTEDRSERALRRLVDEARRDTTPTLEWDALESALLSRARVVQRAPARLSGRSRFLVAAVPAALAALTALAAGSAFILRAASPGSGDAPREAAKAVTAPPEKESLDGDALSTGAVVTSGAEAVVVQHVGHATWTLAPGGIARVESVGDVIGLSLDRGTLSARVTKSTRPESFAIRVEKSRIAVHGTAFRVDRLEKTVHIEVEEGVVAIGPVGGKAFELRAPGSVEVSFDGIRADKARPTTRAATERPGELPAGNELDNAPRNPSETGAKVPPPHAGPPPAEAPGVERVIQAVRHCLSENTVARGDLRVSVRTRLSLRVQATGHVGEVLFDPPLSPPVQACVGAKVGSIGFSASHDGFALERVIELER